MRAFADLTERDLLALAIPSEEEDGRVYADFSQELRDEYPDSARMFNDMAAEEDEHRRRLIDTFTERLGPHIPLAGISMGFAEALADDGKLSGRGTPWLRGPICGLMTVAGGIGHILPCLIPDLVTATVVSGVVVVVELLAIAWIQRRYMDTLPLSAMARVMLGGALVLATGILIGSA